MTGLLPCNPQGFKKGSVSSESCISNELGIGRGRVPIWQAESEQSARLSCAHLSPIAIIVHVPIEVAVDEDDCGTHGTSTSRDEDFHPRGITRACQRERDRRL